MARKPCPPDANSLIKYKYPRRITFEEMAEDIKRATGEGYHPHYLQKVGKGVYPLTDNLLAKLKQTYPDFDQVVG